MADWAAFRRGAKFVCPLVASVFLACRVSAAEIASPQRIASVNLCADQLLLALAPEAKIAALGPFASDPRLSYLAHRAVRFPHLNGRSEELLRVKADAVAVGPFDNKFMRASLARREIAEIVVDQWASLSEVRRGVADFAARIGERQRGIALVEEIDRALHELQRPFSGGPSPSFLILHRRGFVGQGDIVAEFLEIAGLRDAAKGAPGQFMSVEAVLAMRPDFLVVTARNLKAEDRGLELLEHPALRRLYPESRRITAPDRLTICAGPSTPALIRHLRDELDRRWTR